MPQSLQIDWIDYSSRDRNKILSILSLLYTPKQWMSSVLIDREIELQGKEQVKLNSEKFSWRDGVWLEAGSFRPGNHVHRAGGTGFPLLLQENSALEPAFQSG